jgi:hypothetical protein
VDVLSVTGVQHLKVFRAGSILYQITNKIQNRFICDWSGSQNMKKFMTKSQYARHRKISPARVTQLIKNDQILITDTGEVDVVISDVLLDQYSEKCVQVQASTSSPTSSSSSPSDLKTDLLNTLLNTAGSNAITYAEQRALLTKYKAGLAKIQLAEKESQLVNSEEMYTSSFEAARKLRDTLQSMPDRLSGPLAAESDQRKISNRLSTEITRTLKEYIEYVQITFGKQTPKVDYDLDAD